MSSPFRVSEGPSSLYCTSMTMSWKRTVADIAATATACHLIVWHGVDRGAVQIAVKALSYERRETSTSTHENCVSVISTQQQRRRQQQQQQQPAAC